MNAKIITYAIIGVIIITAGYIAITKLNLDDTFDDIINPDDVLYIKYRVDVYKPPIGGGDWQVSVPETETYFAERGNGWASWFGDTEIKVKDLMGKDYSVKFDHDSWAGFTSTKYPIIETSIEVEDLTVGETIDYKLEVYIDGDLKLQTDSYFTVTSGDTGQIVVS